MTQEQLIHRFEEALDFAAPTRLANRREHYYGHVQVSRDLFEVV